MAVRKQANIAAREGNGTGAGRWWIALPCDALGGIVLVLLILDPVDNLTMALALLGPTAVLLHGTALVRWRRRPG